MNLDHILTPVDFSECSIDAVQVAAQLARITHAKITLLHVYSVPVPASDIAFASDTTHYASLEQEAKYKLEDLARELPTLRGIQIKHELDCSYPVHAISAKALELNADLIVMGTMGARGISEVLIGSNAADTVVQAPCPVLCTAKGITELHPRKIAFASDFKNSRPHALDMVKKMAGLFNAEIEILHIQSGTGTIDVHKSAEALNLHHVFEGYKHSYHFFNDDNIIKGIEKFIEAQEVDLFVTRHRDHCILDRLLGTSVTRKMAMHLPVPLLAIPAD
jgi:nucleotide-binding universal stress UspA family protein